MLPVELDVRCGVMPALLRQLVLVPKHWQPAALGEHPDLRVLDLQVLLAVVGDEPEPYLQPKQGRALTMERDAASVILADRGLKSPIGRHHGTEPAGVRPGHRLHGGREPLGEADRLVREGVDRG